MQLVRLFDVDSKVGDRFRAPHQLRLLPRLVPHSRPLLLLVDARFNYQLPLPSPPVMSCLLFVTQQTPLWLLMTAPKEKLSVPTWMRRLAVCKSTGGRVVDSHSPTHSSYRLGALTTVLAHVHTASKHTLCGNSFSFGNNLRKRMGELQRRKSLPIY